MTVKPAPSATESTTEEHITGAELFEMSNVGPCELVEGNIVPMTPTGGQHGQIESKLDRTLGVFVENNQLGWVLVGEVGLYTRRNPDTIRAADIVFISKERTPAGPPRGFLESAPNLVIKVISPANTWIEMRQKIEEYFDVGVDRVWIVEPDTRTILVYENSTEAKKYEEDDVLTGEGALAGFEIAVADIFAV